MPISAPCAMAHSATGDGPLAAGLTPRPADLTQHMALGKHTDGQVFMWIKQGFAGTAMPAWGDRFDDRQIWQIVTYLRGFAQPVAATAAAQPTAALPTAPAASTSAHEPLPPLVFARQGNLWHSDGRAGPPRQLTQLGADILAEHPAVAPDGRQIAFIARSPGPITATLPVSTTTLYLMNADGTDLHTLWQPPRGWWRCRPGCPMAGRCLPATVSCDPIRRRWSPTGCSRSFVSTRPQANGAP